MSQSSVNKVSGVLIIQYVYYDICNFPAAGIRCVIHCKAVAASASKVIEMPVQLYPPLC